MLIRFLLCIVIILTMYGCQSTQNTPGFKRGEAVGRADVQRSIEDAEELAANSLYQDALSSLAPFDVSLLDPEQGDSITRLRSRAWFALSDYTAAEDTLTMLSAWQPMDKFLLGQICEARADYRCSADGYIQAAVELGLNDPQLPADIHDQIWLSLSRARQAPAGFTHKYHHGWWLLQEQIRTAGSITQQIQAWRSWQKANPSHPASIQPPQALRRLDSYETPQIGLLLPLSGAYANAGKAVRDGIIAAYIGDQATDKPQIKFYDSGETPAASLFERAIAGGADVLVGPLIKSEVESFANLTAFSDVPRLVLNYLEPTGLGASVGSTTTPLFQLGIAIEDEATSLANHVLLQGLERLLVVHGSANWSQRAFEAYTQSWPYAVTDAYFQDIKSLTGAVGEAMQVAASEARKNEIADILGQSLEFLPRARGDLDGIVALTSQMETQALLPALRFHFADKLPVYATSQAARGKKIADLSDIELTEMPVFADPTPQQATLNSAFNLNTDPFAELYALGFDAYQVATWLPILDPQSQVALPAATGYLWLEPGGKFRRDLSVSRVTDNGALEPSE